MYLTGFNEPDAALVLQKHRNASSEWTLYVTPKNEHLEMWDGVRTGLNMAISYFGMDHAKSIESLPSFIDSVKSSGIFFTDLFLSGSKNQQESLLESTGINCTPSHATNKPSEKNNLPKILQPYHNSNRSEFFFKKIKQVAPFLDQLRLVKSNDEIKVMRKSGQISGRAFAKAMSLTKPGMSEHHLQSILNYEVMIRGSAHLAYVPVVAGGKNALTLHYIRNDQILKNDDLVLVDCGGVN